MFENIETLKIMKYFYIKTFGCQQNIRDSEIIHDYYISKGYKSTEEINKTDIVIINTCSVRQSAEHRVFGLINNLKKLKKKPRIILTGCMAKLYGKYKLSKKIPEIDEIKFSEQWITSVNPSKTGLINITTGCNNYCTYCVVPFTRGKEKSKPIREIFKEVKSITNKGIYNITLLGQNVNSYGKDLYKNTPSCFHVFKHGNREIFKNDKELDKEEEKKVRNSYQTPFSLLLYFLNRNSKVDKISFITSNPWDLSDDIIEAMRLSKIDRDFHLPVQSGDDEILKKMNRRYTVSQFSKLIKKIKNRIPKIKIGTDIIVGFPGETEKQFQNTVSLIKKVGFVKAYIAMYSPRPRTTAFKMKDDIPFFVKKKRWQILDNLINKKPRKINL